MQYRRIPGIFSVLVIAAACNGGGVAINGTPVALLDYVATAPQAWQSRQPSSTMRLLEFTVPAAAGADSAECVVFYFGAGQGGSVEANLDRWKEQFTDGQGGHPEPVVTQVTGTSFATTLVELHGNYARGIGMGGSPSEALPDQVLLAAVVETNRGNLYVQLHGPSASVLAQKDAYMGFVRSIRPHPTS